ncbi:MAG: cytochrome c3 family protein [Anaerolineae bacterium]|nr:cytochrome c3 family protein [Anaerolineae bacterium]
MTKKPLGCLSLSGVLAALITATLICASYIVWGGKIFSPGKLSAQTGEMALGGFSSHAETGKKCSTCHASPTSVFTMDARCLACHKTVAEELEGFEKLHGLVFDGSNGIICRDCHTDHKGAFAELTNVNSIKLPHEKFGFSISLHQKTASLVPFDCKECHQQSLLEFDEGRCDTCHTNIDPVFMTDHKLAYGNDCRACHDGMGTHAQNFDHFSAEFHLIGKHTALACKDCHSGAHSLAEMGSLKPSCVNCHLDVNPHGQLYGKKCGLCHTPEDWAQANFEHPVDVSENCVKCHQEDAPPEHFDGQCSLCHSVLSWEQAFFDHSSGKAVDCNACHKKDKPRNHFAGQCSACHSNTTWENAKFNHNVVNASNCTACHDNEKPKNHFGGQCSACHNTDTWKGAKFNHAGFTNCSGCHNPNKPKNHYSGQCSACHNTSSWKAVVHKHTFPINHEGANGQCSKCHNLGAAKPYANYTCYNCHEHSPSKVEKEHRKEGIKNFDNCIRCHWDGREHDD